MKSKFIISFFFLIIQNISIGQEKRLTDDIPKQIVSKFDSAFPKTQEQYWDKCYYNIPPYTFYYRVSFTYTQLSYEILFDSNAIKKYIRVNLTDSLFSKNLYKYVKKNYHGYKIIHRYRNIDSVGVTTIRVDIRNYKERKCLTLSFDNSDNFISESDWEPKLQVYF